MQEDMEMQTKMVKRNEAKSSDKGREYRRYMRDLNKICRVGGVSIGGPK